MNRSPGVARMKSKRMSIKQVIKEEAKVIDVRIEQLELDLKGEVNASQKLQNTSD